jgi:membrane protease YdiL (CAAX protease family)
MARKSLSRFLVLFFAGCLISGCTGSVVAVSPIPDFPLSEGTIWTYSYTEYQPTREDPTKTQTARSEIREVLVDTQTAGFYYIVHVNRYRQLIQADPGWIVTQANVSIDLWLIVAGQKVYETLQKPDPDNIQTDTFVLDYDFPLTAGKSWCYFPREFRGAAVDCNISGKMMVDRLERVESPAGTFNDCAWLILTANGGNIFRQFCPGVGLVSEKFGHSGTIFGYEKNLVKVTSPMAGALAFFRLIALSLAALWLLLVGLRFRRSTLALLIGLIGLGLFTLVEMLLGNVTAADLGLARPASWLTTLLFALGGLAVALAYSPVADWVAGRFYHQPPDLQAFKAVQRSWLNLAAGILAAWLLGGILEELIARGIVLKSIESLLAPALGTVAAAVIAILVAAAGAGVMHAYQGPRAMLIIGQISILFGLLFVLSGYNLWAVMIGHGLYDTIAFIRFALKKSKYAKEQPN